MMEIIWDTKYTEISAKMLGLKQFDVRNDLFYLFIVITDF